MKHSLMERNYSTFSRPVWVSTRENSHAKKAVSTKMPTPATVGDAILARQLTNLHRQVMQTVVETNTASELYVRLSAFAEGVQVAIELAEVMKPLKRTEPAEGQALQNATCTLQELSEVAYRALDVGREAKGFQILEAIGSLLGGPPRAALERALGQLRLNRKAKACDCLLQALEGMTDKDGLISGLLAQLWFEARDPRWITLAKRVLATGLNVEARTRCTELLAVIHVK
jgi:hypothetical protein